MTTSKVRLQTHIMYGEKLPCGSFQRRLETDQVLYVYGSYTLDIDSDNVGSCIFVQDRALGGEARYGRPFEN